VGVHTVAGTKESQRSEGKASQAAGASPASTRSKTIVESSASVPQGDAEAAVASAQAAPTPPQGAPQAERQ
jgi:hypothetical protein